MKSGEIVARTRLFIYFVFVLEEVIISFLDCHHSIFTLIGIWEALIMAFGDATMDARRAVCQLNECCVFLMVDRVGGWVGIPRCLNSSYSVIIHSRTQTLKNVHNALTNHCQIDYLFYVIGETF